MNYIKFLTANLLAASVMFGATTSASSQSVQSFTPEQKKAIETIVRNYILENPEILPEAIDALQKKMAAQTIKENHAALFKDPDSVHIGNPAGDVSLVVFLDYTCGYCKMMAPFFSRLVAEDKQVQVIFKEFPVRGDVATLASKAAIAAKAQGTAKYMAFYNALYNAPGQLNEAGIWDAAKLAKLDVAKLKADAAGAKPNTVIRNNHELGQKLEIRGTPALVINNTLIPGALPYTELVKAVATARADLKKK